jgi:hypothetical protein
MNGSTKPVVVQGHQLVLYSKALHPEQMAMKGRRVLRQGAYEIEAWVMQGSHTLRFDYGQLCATELVCEYDKTIPTTSIVSANLCPGEKDVEHKFAKEGVRYIGSMQLETLAPNLYEATYRELVDFGRENAALMHLWSEGAGPGLSMVDMQRFNDQVHAQGYHLVPATGVVVRSQTIFEIQKPQPKADMAQFIRGS